MNMSTARMAALAMAAAFALGAVWAEPHNGRETDEQRAARKERMYRKLGGYVVNTATRKGSFVFVNAQDVVPEGPLKESANSMAEYLMCDFRLTHHGAHVPLADAERVLMEAGATAGAIIAREPGLPALTVAPDGLFAYINVAPLEGDAKLSTRRVRLEMWRALGYLFSIDFEGCMLRPVKGAEGLDGLPNAMSGEALYHVAHMLEQAGITPSTRASYRTACQQGWAPAPTNDVQKAIWDKVHAIPDKPITIEFDPKKDK